jgi:hypothetical protein
MLSLSGSANLAHFARTSAKAFTAATRCACPFSSFHSAGLMS